MFSSHDRPLYLGRTYIRNLATFWRVITHLRPLKQKKTTMFLSFQPQFVVESQQKMFSFDIIVMLLCLFRHDGAE